jgi:hypothetical protein
MKARDASAWAMRYLATAMLVDVGLLLAVSVLVSDGLLFILRKEWHGRSLTSTTQL